MNFQFLVIVLVFICVPSIYAEDTEQSDFTKSIEKTSLSTKIQSILIQWQQAENQKEFAIKNNLPLVDDKVKIYIYLDSQEMKEKLPPEITITGFDGKIVGALVSSDNLDILDKLEFVQKVTVPVLAQPPPIPQIENQKTNISNEKESDDFTWVLILGIMILLVILIIKKRITFITRINKQ